MEISAHLVRPTAALLAIALTGWLLPGGSAAQNAPPAAAEEPGWEEMERRPGAGERCLVCGRRIQDNEIAEIRYKGRTFHVKAEMLGAFAADPDAYFEQLQARGALFDERAMEGRRFSPGWLVFGSYVFVGLVCAAVAGSVAVGRGLPALPWFFAGLAGNVAALLLLMIVGRRAPDAPAHAPMTKLPTTRAPVSCPHCGAENHPSAARCAGCETTLDPAFESEAARA